MSDSGTTATISNICDHGVLTKEGYHGVRSPSEINLTDFSPYGLLLVTSAFEFVQGNAAFFEITGLERESAHGRGWLNCIPHQEVQYLAGAVSRIEELGAVDITIECQIHIANAAGKWVKIVARTAPADHSTGSCLVLTFEDIDDSKRLADKNRQLAVLDPLTGLSNRRSFEDTLSDCLQQSKAGRGILAVLFLDLDGFKQVNDSFGHEAGDDLLKGIANTIKSSSARAAEVARIGGDEFTILLTDIKRIEEVNHYASNLINLLQQTISIKGVEAGVSASVGIAIHHKLPEEQRCVERIVADLLRNADKAMYAAKASGKNCFRFYGNQSNITYARDSLKDTDNLIRSLYHAMNNKEMYVMYQPQISTVSGAVVGCEALLRWNHHSHGLISPSKFIPIVESSGAMNDLSFWIVESICKDFVESFRVDMPGIDAGQEFTISVNLSSVQLQNPASLDAIDQIISSFNVPAALIKFEITEHTLMADPHLAADGLEFLRRRGYRISLDDFGTGYSSLSYLHRFGFDELKLDEIFIRDVTSSEACRTIVKAVVDLAHALGLTVVAEGVEKQAQLDFIKQSGCGYWQGFLRSAGVHPKELSHIINRSNNKISSNNTESGSVI